MSETILTINGEPTPIMDLVKAHVKRNKTHYAWGSALVVTAAASAGGAFLFARGLAPAEVEMAAKQINILSKDNVLLQVVVKPGNSGDVLWDPINKVAYLSKSEASRKLGASMGTIRKMIANGQLEQVIDGAEGLAPVAAVAA